MFVARVTSLENILKRSTKIVSGVLFLVSVLLLGRGCQIAGEINDWIDRCADESKGNYTTDDEARRKACE
jgi:hypothetical protein